MTEIFRHDLPLNKKHRPFSVLAKARTQYGYIMKKLEENGYLWADGNLPTKYTEVVNKLPKYININTYGKIYYGTQPAYDIVDIPYMENYMRNEPEIVETVEEDDDEWELDDAWLF